jgi:Tfp pilus assembly protein PilZ
MGDKSAAKAKAPKTKAADAPQQKDEKKEEPAPPPPPPARGPRHLRAPIEIRVEITARSQSFTTTSRNIALGGISFESQQQFRVGDLVNVLLYIPVKKELELLTVASEVVWVEDLAGSWMCGTAFRKFAPGDERRLREWLLESVRAQKAGAAPPQATPDDEDDE